MTAKSRCQISNDYASIIGIARCAKRSANTAVIRFCSDLKSRHRFILYFKTGAVTRGASCKKS
ncbi:MAG: hypothetical protein LBU81_01660 [Methanosarcinales archaeon]|nr:hypothetical protein [Methanosarcinales archaeon]